MKMILCQVNIGTRGKSLVIKKGKIDVFGEILLLSQKYESHKESEKSLF